MKESLFNIIQNKIEDAVVLDLFSGSGAIGIEFLSRGAKKAYLCDNSIQAVEMIKKNLIKTRLLDKAIIYNKDYNKCIEKLQNIKFDIVFLDPPYNKKFAIDAVEKINNSKLLQKDGIIIIETDEPDRDIKELENKNINIEIYDLRKYGRASLIFLRTKSI